MDLFKNSYRLILQNLRLLSLFVVVAGVSLFSREFAKVQWHSLYVLEIAALVWFVSTLGLFENVSWDDLRRALLAPTLFFVYGLTLTAYGVFRSVSLVEPFRASRVFQHGVLFVYPLLWMFIGWWTGRFEKRSHWISWSSVMVSWPNLIAENVSNISVGPLLVVPWIKSVADWFSRTSRRWQFGILAVGFGVLACLPFWVMWLDILQRTSFLIFVFLVVFSPFGFRDENVRLKKSLGVSLAAILFYVVGQIAIMSIHSAQIAHTAVKKEKSTIEIAAPKPEKMHIHAKPVNLTSPPLISPPPMKVITPIPVEPISVSNTRRESPSELAPVHSGREQSGPKLTHESNPPAIAEPAPVPPQPPVPAPSFEKSFKKSFKANVSNAVLHGEDRPIPGEVRLFPMRQRRFLWKTAMHDWNRHPILGVGFVAEVPSYTRPGFTSEFESAFLRRPPLAGPHNSYISVLARTGIVGFVLFLAILVSIGLAILVLLRAAPLSIPDVLLCVIPINGMIYALLNSGFESPHNCVLVWLFAGLLLAKADSLSTVFQSGKKPVERVK